MEKYIVRVDIAKKNQKGILESENFEFSFKDLNLIDSRNKAIAKVKELIDFYTNELPEMDRLLTFDEAINKKLETFSIFKIDIYFSIDEITEYLIYDFNDIGLMIESMEKEANYYTQKSLNQPLIYIHNGYYYGAHLLEEQIDFFLEVMDKIDNED